MGSQQRCWGAIAVLPVIGRGSLLDRIGELSRSVVGGVWVHVKAPSLGSKPAPPVGQINGTDRPVGPPMPGQKLRQPGRSKRPLMLALMVLLMVISALAAWFFVQKSTERIAVVGVAHDVSWGQEIQASDLVAVEMVPDPALKPVSWDQRSTVVGQLAATDLQTGMLL